MIPDEIIVDLRDERVKCACWTFGGVNNRIHIVCKTVQTALLIKVEARITTCLSHGKNGRSSA